MATDTGHLAPARPRCSAAHCCRHDDTGSQNGGAAQLASPITSASSPTALRRAAPRPALVTATPRAPRRSAAAQQRFRQARLVSGLFKRRSASFPAFFVFYLYFPRPRPLPLTYQCVHSAVRTVSRLRVFLERDVPSGLFLLRGRKRVVSGHS